MVNVTMDQIIAFRNNGDFFAETTLPLKGAYKLNKIKKAVETEGEYYVEKFQEIVNKYAKKDENGQLVFSEDGNQIMIKDGMVDECNQALEDLQNLEVQIENYGLSLADLGEDVECTPDELEILMPFME
jgi:Skp family chaperone for outer membrane proteins